MEACLRTESVQRSEILVLALFYRFQIEWKWNSTALQNVELDSFVQQLANVFERLTWNSCSNYN